MIMKAVPVLLQFLSVLALFASGHAVAQDVWFVNTQSAKITGDGRLDSVSVEQWASESKTRRWTPSGMDEFLHSLDSEKPTVIVVHGNLMSPAEARSYGLAFHRKAKGIGDHRLVIWCWPAEKEYCRIRPDAQAKYHRADAQGRYLGAFLREFRGCQPEAKVAILGFSYGAKVTCKALDELGREWTANESSPTKEFQIRPVLLAAAMNRTSLSSGKEYGQALSVVDEMLVHVNQSDETLRFYPLLFRLCGPQAVGKEGVSLHGISAENRRKIKSVRVDRLLGGEHGFINSLHGILANKKDFRHYVLFQ